MCGRAVAPPVESPSHVLPASHALQAYLPPRPPQQLHQGSTAQSDAPGPGSFARPEKHGAAANCMRSDRRTGVGRLQLAQRSGNRPQHSSGKEPHPGADTGDSSLCVPVISSSALAGRQIAQPTMFPAAPTGSLFLWLNTCEDLHAPLQGALEALPPPEAPTCCLRPWAIP